MAGIYGNDMAERMEARADAAESLASDILLCRTNHYENIKADGDRITLTTGSGEYARCITLIVVNVENV